MSLDSRLLPVALFTLAIASCAFGQASSAAPDALPQPSPVSTAPSTPLKVPANSGSQPLFDFHETEIKFNLASLMRILRDGSHEGWVLAAYPDPKTKRPLIGAGFSLDVEAREHPQSDPMNPHPFLEPSSAQLWQAGGLEPERLQRILDQYDRHLDMWTPRGFRRKLAAHALTPEVSDEEAMRLLRISAVQAIYNAKAYCRGFDQLSASQQMALSQLVFQMGVNLEEFVQFLGILNSTPTPGEGTQVSLSQPALPGESQDSAHWRTVQDALIASQWARLYSRRASTVIAMFDPRYADDPAGALHRVNVTLHPAVGHRRKAVRGTSVRVASQTGQSAKTPRKRSSRSQRKPRAG